MRLLNALLAATLPLATNGWAQLLPAGEFAARDGRPGKGLHWTVTDLQGAAIAARMNAVADKTPVVIDYEHHTMTATDKGHKALAAGWIKRAEWRSGEGLFAQVEWTAQAKAHIAAGEYRYISPVIAYDAAGTVRDVPMAALVNFPALLGMEAVLAHLSTQFSNESSTEEPEMKLAALIALFGLSANATETDVDTALHALKAEHTALKAKPEIPSGLVTALGLAAGADETTAVAALAALKGGQGADKTAMAALSTEVQTLRGQMLERDLAELLDGAILATKITPAQRASLADIGKRDFAWLKTHIASLQAIPGLAGQSGQGDNEGRDAKHTDNVDAQDLARRAVAYQQTQLKGGIEINTAQAVAAVVAGAK